jgi:hypothetical protein
MTKYGCVELKPLQFNAQKVDNGMPSIRETADSENPQLDCPACEGNTFLRNSVTYIYQSTRRHIPEVSILSSLVVIF